jgi:primase-polymerase (primpol)-like protein
MNNLLSFESFSKRVKSETQAKLSEEKVQAQRNTTTTFENLLKKFDVTSPSELSEDKKQAFISELFGNDTVTESIINEADVKSDEDFKEYAIEVLKKAHGDDYDQAKADKAIEGILKKAGSDYGAAVGMLTSGLSEAATTISGTPKTDAEKKVAKFLNAMAKDYDYPVEDAIRATVAAIKKLGYEKLVEGKVYEADVKSDADFKEYATEVLKQAHGKDFDQSKADKAIEGILKKAGSDYGAAIGMLTSGLK